MRQASQLLRSLSKVFVPRFQILLVLPFLVAVVASFDLKCTAVTNTIGYTGSMKYCDVHWLNITFPNATVTSVNGAKTPTEFQGLLITNMVLHYLPRGIGKFFPKLRLLYVYNSGVKSIEASDLEGLSNLEGLQIFNNDIEELSSDLFNFTPKINDVYIPNNQISSVGKDLLANLTSLKRIEFSNNQCIDSGTESDFEIIKQKLQEKCPHPDDQPGTEESKRNEKIIASLKRKSSQREFEMGKKMEELTSEIEHLKRTCYHGLLDSSTKLLHKVTRQLKECRTARTTEEKVETSTDVVLKVLSATENATILEMNIESPESKVTKIVDASGDEVKPNQTEIVIDQQNALFLPVNLGQFFPSIQRLSVTFSGLYGLDTRTFSGMQNLVAINFTGNKLVEISKDAFAELSNLTELDLSHNNIEFIHEEAFKQNVDLEILRLSHNQLTAINSPIFRYQKKLRIIFLDDIKLKFANAMLLSTLKAVEVVDLTNNVCINFSYSNTTMEEIEAGIMDKCYAPVELKCKYEIQGNQTDETYCQAENLEVISPGTILSMQMAESGGKIQKLSIVDQKVILMPSRLSGTLPNLTQVVVEKSQLTALHKTDFEGLTSLKEITIERNKISLIEEGVFDEVPQITYLNLGHNDIESLPPQIFVKLTLLKTLILSGNKLKTFTASLLPPKPVIKDFRLRENILEMIESKVVKMLKNADLIDLSNNTCIDMKYQKSYANGTTLMEIHAKTEFDCVDSDEQS